MFQRATTACHRLVDLPQPPQHLAQIAVRLGVIRLDRQRAAIAFCRGIRLAPVFQDHAIVPVRFGIVGQKRGRHLHRGQRILALDMLRHRQHLPEEARARIRLELRLGQALQLGIFAGAEQIDQRGGVRRRRRMIAPDRRLAGSGVLHAAMLEFFPAAAAAGVISFRFQDHDPCLREPCRFADEVCHNGPAMASPVKEKPLTKRQGFSGSVNDNNGWWRLSALNNQPLAII